MREKQRNDCFSIDKAIDALDVGYIHRNNRYNSPASLLINQIVASLSIQKRALPVPHSIHCRDL